MPGEAALTFDPYDVEAMAAVMVTLVEDVGLRVRLRAQGLEHAAGFTWERTARGTMERYGEVVGGS